MTLEVINEGYLNVYDDGEMIVSVDEDRQEVAVYNRGQEEPTVVVEYE